METIWVTPRAAQSGAALVEALRGPSGSFVRFIAVETGAAVVRTLFLLLFLVPLPPAGTPTAAPRHPPTTTHLPNHRPPIRTSLPPPTAHAHATTHMPPPPATTTHVSPTPGELPPGLCADRHCWRAGRAVAVSRLWRRQCSPLAPTRPRKAGVTPSPFASPTVTRRSCGLPRCYARAWSAR